MKRKNKGNFIRSAGSTASLACALHCAVTPFAAALIPAAGGGLGFASLHAFEPFLIGAGIVLGLFFLIREGHSSAFFKTRLAMMTAGIGLFCASLVWDHSSLHMLLSFSGAMLIAGSQAAFLFRIGAAHVHGPECGH